MKVKLGPYKNWFGPYQLAETLCFWVKEKRDEYGLPCKPEWVHKFGEFLAHGFSPDESDLPKSLRINKERPRTWLYDFLEWINSKKEREVYIHIDKWDTWDMYSTLSMIILPMLKQLKMYNNGSGIINLEDVPEHLRSYDENSKQLSFDFNDGIKIPDMHDRYNWVLDEMIWTFEQLQPNSNWEEQYYSGESDVYFENIKKTEDDKQELCEMKTGPDDTFKIDGEGLKKHQQRIDNGLRLFGKYFQTLWD